MSKGIDYGMGQTNVDLANGIRFGVINMNALSHYAWEDMEDDYGDPACPKCGGEVVEYDSEKHDNFTHHRGCSDHTCESCEEVFDGDQVIGDEPNGYNLDTDELKGRVGTDGDLMLFKSPYYTHAQFCSPCAPGAGHLENYTPDGVKTYCLPKEWFEGEKVPYPVYRVDNDELVTPMHPESDDSGELDAHDETDYD